MKKKKKRHPKKDMVGYDWEDVRSEWLLVCSTKDVEDLDKWRYITSVADPKYLERNRRKRSEPVMRHLSF